MAKRSYVYLYIVPFQHENSPTYLNLFRMDLVRFWAGT